MPAATPSRFSSPTSIPTSSPNPGGPGLLPATDLMVYLGSFNGFNLLPPGDLLFNVSLQLNLDLPFGQVFNNDTTHLKRRRSRFQVPAP